MNGFILYIACLIRLVGRKKRRNYEGVVVMMFKLLSFENIATHYISQVFIFVFPFHLKVVLNDTTRNGCQV